MTSQPVPADGDPRRLLAEVRDLARRVRVDQRATWLPLLVLAVVTFAAIPVMRYGAHHIDCTQTGDLRMCKVTHPAARIYWPIALVVAYAVIAAGYLRIARRRGLGTRIWPYAWTGAAVAVAMALSELWIVHHLDGLNPPFDLPGYLDVAFRLDGMSGAIGIGLLVLAWLERSPALLLFTAAYLAVVLIPVGFGWHLRAPSEWAFLPQLAIDGTVLLLGAAGFALAGRRSR